MTGGGGARAGGLVDARKITDAVLLDFAEEVGDHDGGPVVVVGARTQWDLGGVPHPGARLVSAPTGLVAFEPAEMTVTARAGTTVGELDAVLSEARQQVVAGGAGFSPQATLGGVLAVGRSGPERLGWGPLRDCLLQARYVSDDGLVVTAGGPTVKNVTGFDLCRLLVGSLGTLGFLAEVTLRTRPRPAVRRWLAGATEHPQAVRAALYRPTSVLWDGDTAWVLLEGHTGDVEAEAAAAAGLGLVEVEGPPSLPPHRSSHPPGQLPVPAAASRFVEEIGVGVLHSDAPVEPPPVSGPVRALNARIKALFDPDGRLNPGRSVLP